MCSSDRELTEAQAVPGRKEGRNSRITKEGVAAPTKLAPETFKAALLILTGRHHCLGLAASQVMLVSASWIGTFWQLVLAGHPLPFTPRSGADLGECPSSMPLGSV